MTGVSLITLPLMYVNISRALVHYTGSNIAIAKSFVIAMLSRSSSKLEAVMKCGHFITVFFLRTEKRAGAGS